MQEIETSIDSARAIRMKALWQDEGFRMRMTKRHRRSKVEIQEAKAMRLTKASLRQQKAAERAARREARVQRKVQREAERLERRTARERKQAEKLARTNMPIPMIQVDLENMGMPWKTLRNSRVIVFENGKLVKRSLWEIGETGD